MSNRLLHRQVRFFDVARAFAIIASHPDTALDVALEVDDDSITVLESNLHTITARMNGDKVAAEIEALLSHPFFEVASEIKVPKATAKQLNGGFGWTPVANPGALPGNLRGAFVCGFHGLQLEVKKLGPANYEGRLNGESIIHGKFKKNVRERLEKEATKRVNA